MAVTIREVARRAGVSTATVSHVLNNTGRVRLRTRRAVMEVIRELGYVPNAHARTLALGHTHTLGAIVSDLNNPFFPEVIRGFETRARELGYEVSFAHTLYEAGRERAAARLMLEQKVRGVALLTSQITPEILDPLRERGLAMAYLNHGTDGERLESPGGVASIRLDHAKSTRDVVQYLYRLGHRRLAFAGGRPGIRSYLARLAAFEEALGELGLAPAAVVDGNQDVEGGFRAARTLAALKPRPTAVIAVNDYAALGVIRGLHESGLRVPQDVSVSGFDRTALAGFLVPSLTTVDLHRDLIGRTAAEALHEMISSGGAVVGEYLIPAELVLGESTAPAAGKK
jgi:LacI family transcriptional regulator